VRPAPRVGLVERVGQEGPGAVEALVAPEA
jgi:hypothetical protein